MKLMNKIIITVITWLLFISISLCYKVGIDLNVVGFQPAKIKLKFVWKNVALVARWISNQQTSILIWKAGMEWGNLA